VLSPRSDRIITHEYSRFWIFWTRLPGWPSLQFPNCTCLPPEGTSFFFSAGSFSPLKSWVDFKRQFSASPEPRHPVRLAPPMFSDVLEPFQTRFLVSAPPPNGWLANLGVVSRSSRCKAGPPFTSVMFGSSLRSFSLLNVLRPRAAKPLNPRYF